MSERDDGNAAKIGRGIVAGLIAGAVASFAMDRFQAMTAPLLPSGGGDSEPATQKAANAIMKNVTGQALPKADGPLAGQSIHYVLGIGLGIAYGVAAEFRPSITRGFGSAFGLGTATVLDEAMVPAVGLGSPPWQSDMATTLYSYASHLVFGGVGEIVRRQVAGTLG